MRSRWYWFGIVLIIAGAVGFILTGISDAHSARARGLRMVLSPPDVQPIVNADTIEYAVSAAIDSEKFYFASLLAVAVGVTILHREHIARQQP